VTDAASNPIVYYERPEDEEHAILGKPLRVVAKLRNNRLIRAREELGLMSAKAAADKLGVDYQMLIRYEGLKVDPWDCRRGDWKEGARRIADAYGYHPEELWPEVTREVQRTTAILEVGAADVPLALSPPAPDADLAIDCRRALASLPPREAAVIRRRFGIDEADGDCTLKEIGVDLPSQAASTLAYVGAFLASEGAKAQADVLNAPKGKARKDAQACLRALTQLAGCISYPNADDANLLPSPSPHGPYMQNMIIAYMRAVRDDPLRAVARQHMLAGALRRLSATARLGVSRA
jgi:lambda repressor-like predicted transcriptional regulator